MLTIGFGIQGALPVFSVRVKMVTAAAVVSASAFASVAMASTVHDLASAEAESPAAITLSSLLRQDALGDACIEEADIDQAFFATGKGLRLPRTCLPDPCSQALTPFRLAELIGRPAQASEWDRYFSRYADACRKEVVSFDDDATAADPLSPAEFWAPILGGRVVGGQLIPRDRVFDQPLPERFAPRLGGGAPPTLQPLGTGGPARPNEPPLPPPFDTPPQDDPETPTGWPDPDTPPPAPVPLPAGIWMLLAAVISLVGLRRAKG